MIVQPRDGRTVLLSSILCNKDNNVAGKILIRSCSTVAGDSMEYGLYVCLSDAPSQTAQLIKQANESGASAVIIRKGIFSEDYPLPHDVFEVEEPQEVYGRACQELLDNPARKLKLIAITGTSGKTSLSYVIAGMLAESGSPVGLIGSLGTYNGKSLLPGNETTQSPDRLALRLKEMVDNGCTHAILEVSSEAIDQHYLAGLIFDAICLTNIRRDHLDYHGSLENYRQTKLKIFDYSNSHTVAICNADDRVTEAILHLIPCPTLTVGLHPTDCMVSGMAVEQNRGGQTFYIVAGIDAVPIHTKIIGTEHIYNCLIAAALGNCWNIDLKTIVPGIERVEHIPGRLEQIDCGQPFSVFVDNANTAESLSASLRTIRTVVSGKIYCVLGVPSGTDRSKRPVMGHTAESLSDLVAITASTYGEMAQDNDLSEVVQGFETRDRNVRSWNKRKDAVVWALSDAGPEDAILIVGGNSGIDAQTPEESVSDRQFVRCWLYENQPCLEPFWY